MIFLTFPLRGSFNRKNFKRKKYIWDYGVNFWKNGSFVCKLNEIAEAVPSIDSAADDFLQFIYSVLVAKNY